MFSNLYFNQMLPFLPSSTDYKNLQEQSAILVIIEDGQSCHKRCWLRDMNALLSLLEEKNCSTERRHGNLYLYQKPTISFSLCLVKANFPQAEKHAIASTTCLYRVQSGTTTAIYIALQVAEKLHGLKNSILYSPHTK